MEYYIQIKQLLIDSFNEVIQTASNYLPNLVTALALIIMGVLLAWFGKWLIVRLSVGVDRIVHAIGITSVPVIGNWPFGIILGWLVFWIVILLFMKAAVDSLGFPGLASWLESLISNLPVYLIAAVCIVAGVMIGNYVRNLLQGGGLPGGLRQTEMLGSFLRVVIITFAVITGLAQLGLDVSLIEQILVIMVAATAGSIALAFGLGAGPILSNIISGHYVKKNYQIGQRIRINDVDGEILELLPTGVVLDTPSGRTFIPAKLFDENASVLLDNEELNEHK
jgi:small-conductance mechanosensitive channel